MKKIHKGQRGEILSKPLKPLSVFFPVSSGCIVVSIYYFYNQQKGHFHLENNSLRMKWAGEGEFWLEAISLLKKFQITESGKESIWIKSWLFLFIWWSVCFYCPLDEFPDLNLSSQGHEHGVGVRPPHHGWHLFCNALLRPGLPCQRSQSVPGDTEHVFLPIAVAAERGSNWNIHSHRQSFSIICWNTLMFASGSNAMSAT